MLWRSVMMAGMLAPQLEQACSEPSQEITCKKSVSCTEMVDFRASQSLK